jgi:hypothetical protein
VAHSCNPSYLGGRDQEDCISKPAGANSSQDPILKTPSQKKGCVVVQGVVQTPLPEKNKKFSSL